MMMNLDKIISNFISGTIELNDVIEKYDISYFLLVKLIKNYCYSNKIPIAEDISYRLNAPIRGMLDLRRHGMSYRKLSEKYNCTSDAIRQVLIKYCEQNNLEILKVKSGPKQKTLPMKEIYELKSQGLTYKEIAEEYNCKAMTILRRLKEYCEQNNLEIPKNKELPIEEIYKLKSQGMSYREIAEKHDCSYGTIRQRLKEYEEELVLRNKYLEILLQDFTGIKDDILNKTIGSFYNYSENKKHDDYSFVKR